MSAKRRVSLRVQVKREINLWCLFALDGMSLFARTVTPLQILPSAEALEHAEGTDAQLTGHLSAWREDIGVARLLFTHIKNRAKLEAIWRDDALWDEVYAEVSNYLRYQVAIDDLISQSSLRWKIQRMGSVDRAVLRLGTYELCFHEKTPARAVLNQAIELGKRYGSSESSRFINGVLDRVAQELERIKRRADPAGKVSITRK